MAKTGIKCKSTSPRGQQLKLALMRKSILTSFVKEETSEISLSSMRYYQVKEREMEV